MCQRLQSVRVPGSRHSIYVGCGRCPSCLQKKANKRSELIRNQHPEGYTPYFVTLTYNDKSLPYILLKDCKHSFSSSCDGDIKQCSPCDSFSVPIYRDVSFLRGRSSWLFRIYQRNILSNVELDSTISHSLKYVSRPRYLQDGVQNFSYHTDRIGVYYPKDCSDFIKRLRTRLFRRFKSWIKLYYYSAPEYGPTTHRPHLHLCIWVPSFVSTKIFQDECVSAWPFASPTRTREFIEVAKNISAYLASYVNCDASIPRPFLNAFPLRPTHSLYLGFDNPAFAFDKVLDKITSSSECFYTSVFYHPDSGFSEISRLYPRYVLHRFFIKIKSFGAIPREILYSLYLYPEEYLKKVDSLPPRVLNSNNIQYARNVRLFNGEYLYMNDREVSLFINGLHSRYYYFWLAGYNWFDYSRLLVDGLINYQLALLRIQYANNIEIDDYVYMYDNVLDVLQSSVHIADNFFFCYYNLSSMKPILPPHLYPNNVYFDEHYSKKYFSYIKHRKVGVLNNP